LLSFESDDVWLSKTGSFCEHLSASIEDPDILVTLKKEYDKGDTGVLSCLSFLKETLIEQKKVNRHLHLRIKEEDELFRSLGDKVKKNKARLYELLETHRKSLYTSKPTTVEEQNEPPCGNPELILKINQTR